jgi:hypothetical protein
MKNAIFKIGLTFADPSSWDDRYSLLSYEYPDVVMALTLLHSDPSTTDARGALVRWSPS